MADDDTTTQTAPPPAALPAGMSADQVNQIIQQYQLAPQMPQRDMTPVSRSWTSLLGEALSGGPPVGGMTPAEQEIAGRHALMNFGTGLMAASRYSPGQTIFSNLAQGFQGAQRGEVGSEELAMNYLGAQQDWALKQQQAHLEALKTALPFLRLQQAAGIPNPLAGGSAPGGTASGSGGATVASGNAGDFQTSFAPIAAQISAKTGLPVDYVIGQAGLETGWGSSPAAKNNNFFGITDPKTGKLMTYASPQEGAQAYIDLMGTDRYKNVPRTGTPQQIGDSMAIAGYNPNVPKKDSTDSYGARVAAFAGTLAKGAPGTKIAATMPPAATTGPPGVQMGGEPPAPPGGSGAPSTGGIGTALNPPPPVAVKGSPLPAGKLQTTGKPPGVAGDVGAILGGMKLAQGGLPSGTVAAAGPAAGTPATSVAWGPATTTTIGNYNAPGTAAAPTTVPPSVPTPQGTTQAQQPPGQPAVTGPTPGGLMSFEDWQKLHPGTAGLVTVPPETLQKAQAEEQSAAVALQQANLYGDLAAQSKANQAHIAAANNLARLQQDAQSKSIDTQRQLYNDDQTRIQQAQLKAQELAQTVAENQKNRDADVRKAELAAGYTAQQKFVEDDAQMAQKTTLDPMAAAAMKAHQMNLGLAQLQPLLKDAPAGGGIVGSILNAHPDLAPLMSTAGLLTSPQADAVRLINGLVSNISTEMKPTGLGALREYEWDAFKSQLPNLLSTPEGQQKALAMLSNMNNRIQQESAWMNNYYQRQVPNEFATVGGGATRSAHNLAGQGGKTVQQLMDADLGPIVPRYQGAPTGSGQATWEASLPPGKPYYKTWAVPDPKNPGQPLRDSKGNVQTTTTLEYKPWQ